MLLDPSDIISKFIGQVKECCALSFIVEDNKLRSVSFHFFRQYPMELSSFYSLLASERYRNHKCRYCASYFFSDNSMKRHLRMPFGMSKFKSLFRTASIDLKYHQIYFITIILNFYFSIIIIQLLLENFFCSSCSIISTHIVLISSFCTETLLPAENLLIGSMTGQKELPSLQSSIGFLLLWAS